MNKNRKINIEIAFFMIIHSIISRSFRYCKTKVLLNAIRLLFIGVRLQPRINL